MARIYPDTLTTSVLVLLLLSACAGHVNAPVESPDDKQTVINTRPHAQNTERTSKSAVVPEYYKVKSGDTLYSIAWNYGFDYREVATWNNINKPYTIYPGQKIKLRQESVNTTNKSGSKPLQAGPIIRKADKPVPANTPHQSPASVNKNNSVAVSRTVDKLNWIWPTAGKLVKADTPISKNGIDISGNVGQEIKASAGGDVVYSGSGLLGYGKLIIIKHNDIYLSAYAHNNELLVREGQQVKRGQLIARMGQTSSGRTILHFEIRKNGQPVSPLQYLPAH